MTNPERHVVHIRNATLRDAGEIARLLTQLGHPTTPADVEHRWGEWEEQGNSALVVGDEASPLLGFCQLHQTAVLHRPRPVARITALIVDESRRGTGIGRALVAAAEMRMLSSGCGLMEITSNVRRADAHAFYESLGYEKGSVRLAKDLLKDVRADQ
ncbi:MAG: GNAT family N-acetyltransferase [Gemmatimonadaceae bacterium]